MESRTDITPDGPAWAAILAAAFGCVSFALLVDLAEVSKACSKLLNFYSPSGDLSGKSTVAIVSWLIAWAFLHLQWRGRRIASPARMLTIVAAMLLLSILLTFPPIFGMLG